MLLSCLPSNRPPLSRTRLSCASSARGPPCALVCLRNSSPLASSSQPCTALLAPSALGGAVGVRYTLVTRASLACAAAVRCAQSLEEEPGALRTLWVRRKDVQSAQYAAFAEVDLRMTVSAFKLLWMAKAKLDVDPSLVALRLVRCCSRKPVAEEEEAAVLLDDPSLSLGEAGVTDTAWLLVDAVNLALLAAEREEQAAVARAEREDQAALARARRGALLPEREHTS